MKKIIVIAVLGLMFSINSYAATEVACLHPPSSPNEDWDTSFPTGDSNSLNNAVNACLRNGGVAVVSLASINE